MTRRPRASFAAPAVAALVIALPTLVGVGYSAAAAVGLTGYAAGGLTFNRVQRVLSEAAVWRGLIWTLGTALVATLLAAFGAILVAALFRGPRTTDRIARTLAVVPLPIPHLVAAATAVLLLGQSGLLARLAAAIGLAHAPADLPALVYDRPGIGFIMALAWKELPFLALLAVSVLATRGAALEETARSLGATPWEAFRRVTWPMLWRGLLPGAVAVFAFATGSYEAAVLLAPSDPLALPLLTYERYTDADLFRRDDAFVLALLALGVSALAVAAHEWARRHWERFDA
jgi:putative spermidine/putrescine transport system permease protein